MNVTKPIYIKNKHNQNSFKIKYSVCTPLSRCNCRKYIKYINTRHMQVLCKAYQQAPQDFLNKTW